MRFYKTASHKPTACLINIVGHLPSDSDRWYSLGPLVQAGLVAYPRRGEAAVGGVDGVTGGGGGGLR